MESYRSGFRLTLAVLKAIDDKETPKDIKTRLSLSRYSYEYTINHLLNNGLINEDMSMTARGKNIIRYSEKDEIRNKIILNP